MTTVEEQHTLNLLQRLGRSPKSKKGVGVCPGSGLLHCSGAATASSS